MRRASAAVTLSIVAMGWGVVILNRRTPRLRLAANVLRGRSVMYRLEVRDGTLILRAGALVAECRFTGGDPAIAAPEVTQ